MSMSDCKPIFVFSSSWRSGSTLLQRYITASGEALIWGETGGALNALKEALAGWEQITADSARRFNNCTGGKGEQTYRDFIDKPKSEHAQQWIANLTPPYQDILDGIRSTLLELYGKRAEELGYPRFGIKETRCDIATAHCLKTLFPDARFVFLVRDPLDVMLSIKRRNWMGRPSSHATLHFYAEHWATRSAQFRQAGFGMSLRYEDFIADPALRNRLLDYLEIDTRPPADFIQTSQVDWKAHDQSQLGAWERARLRYWLADEMRQWGY
jgi:hypothetical protein